MKPDLYIYNIMSYADISLQKHKQYKWKLATTSKVPLENKEDLSTYYSPWVAAPCLEIAKNPSTAYDYTWKNNSVAIISDGSAVLWLGNIWWLAGLPVMEGKAILMKQFAWLDAIPLVLDTQDPDEIINIVKNVAPTFGAINLEDIKAPQCFYIEQKCKELTDIPVFHDDQHGTAIVVLAALINALKLIEKDIADLKIVISWAWAAGTAIAKLLWKYGATNIIVLDSRWALTTKRDWLNTYKQELVAYNKEDLEWWLSEVIIWADMFVWVSQPDIMTAADVQAMSDKPLVFALSNPNPEITLETAIEAGAYIYAAWRSDVSVQINNILAFPGIMRWAIDGRLSNIEDTHKLAAAIAIASMVDVPNQEYLLPDALESNVAQIVAQAVMSVG